MSARESRSQDEKKPKRRLRVRVWIPVVIVSFVPLLAMQLSDEVVWDLADFLVFAALLFGVGLTIEWTVRKTGSTAYRSAVGFALVAAFLLIWVNGAVGIIGSENNGANLMYAGVLAIGFIGAIIARFQAYGMARAILATALAQVLVAAIALMGGMSSSGPFWPKDMFLFTGFFTALWVGSACLFWIAVRKESPDGTM